MNIRRKVIFINIISAVIVVIVAVGLLVFYFEFEINPTIKDYYRTRHKLYHLFLALDSEGDCLKMDLLPRNPFTAYLIADLEGHLKATSPKTLFPGVVDLKTLSPGDFVRQLSSGCHRNDQEFLCESVINKKAGLVLYFFSIKPKTIQGILQPSLVGVVSLIIGVFLVSTAILSSVLLQKTGSNIQTLERATRRISEGDLDFQLESNGEDEIADLAHSFDSMRRSLQEERSARNRFLMGVSHDLKTPLTTLKGYLEALKDGVIETDEIPHVVERLVEKAGLLEERISELLHYVRLKTGEWVLSIETVSLNAMISDLESLYRDEVRLSRRSLQIENRLPHEVFVAMDPALFSRLLENLINNAVKYSEPSGTIQLIAETALPSAEGDASDEVQAEGVAVSVVSRGKVISPEEQRLIFEPFYRSDPARNTPGFGLGLSIVKSIADSHGWQVGVRSDRENGTVFTVRMPLKPEA